MSTSTPCVEYELIVDAEWPHGYEPGGYHPISINDCLHDRYRIIDKLGFGSYSTTWLAVDQREHKYVAVKVGTADADNHEAEILSSLSKDATPDGHMEGNFLNAASLVARITDSFELSGPNGTHFCIVRPPARCSLRNTWEVCGNGLFQLDVARSLAAQLALAIAFVHSKGYCHGDLHFGNLLLQETSSLNSLSVDEIYDRFGVPDPNPVVRVDGNPLSPGVPSHIFTPIQSEYKTENIELEEAKLLLNDFGTSFRPSEKSRFESFAPMSVCPPEALFEPDVPLSFASDIWSLGCAIFQLMAIRPLLDDTFCTSQDDITAQQVELQGVMPGKWWSRWEERAKWFDEEGNPLGDPKGVWSWERRLREWVMEPRQHYDMDAPDDEEKTALLELLKTVLAWKPTDRPSAQEVLSMPWMTKWALPTYEKARKTWA